MTGGPPFFGLFLPQLRMDFGTIEHRVRVAEESGFHSVWLMDHLAPPGLPEADCLEGWTLASALAMRTSSIRLGHLVLCDAFRHPAVLAKMATTLDVISGGRLELGLGWGSLAQELKAFGVSDDPAPVRAARLAETLEILELMFHGDPVSFAGTYYHLDGAVARPRPVAGRIPIHLGGAGTRLTLPLVARFADWWNCPAYAVEQVATLKPLAGSARLSIQHPVGLAASSVQREKVAATAHRRFGSWGGLIAGTPDEVAASLRREVELGADLFVLQFSDFGLPQTLRLFADEVMPAVADAVPGGRAGR
jgi:alkanesulfonate monooxygenase SsuD/methylene tetrahydromethanopterin reductase-like flavin-dependent oxidoreductase (luciferase family)